MIDLFFYAVLVFSLMALIIWKNRIKRLILDDFVSFKNLFHCKQIKPFINNANIITKNQKLVAVA